MTKNCPRCKTDLDVSKFTKAKNRRDGLQPYCIKCSRQYRREHYHQNKDPYIQRAKDQKAKCKAWLKKYKAEGSCKDCGVSYPEEPWLMEFDHLRDKKGSVPHCTSTMKTLLEEIEKCDLVCVVCHRRRTAKREGWSV